MINAETYRLAVKMICEEQPVSYSAFNESGSCDDCPLVHRDECPAFSVSSWLQDHPDKAAEIERMVAEMEDETK